MLNNKQTHKLNDTQFKQLLAQNNGNFAATAKAIQQYYGIAYTRQAVRQRAKNFAGDLSDRLYAFAVKCADKNRNTNHLTDEL